MVTYPVQLQGRQLGVRVVVLRDYEAFLTSALQQRQGGLVS
jgi:hypothetical protein